MNATSFGDSVSLGPEWLFHPGDDPQWATPTFDDHDWTVVSAQRELTSYGFRNLRTSAISMRSAQEIASEARAFGQQDDITVFTVGLGPVPVAV